MKFKEFWDWHRKIMPYINFDAGKPGFVDIVRVWNSRAFFNPEQCEDVIKWEIGQDPMLIPNPSYLKEEGGAPDASSTIKVEKKPKQKTKSKGHSSAGDKQAPVPTEKATAGSQ